MRDQDQVARTLMAMAVQFNMNLSEDAVALYMEDLENFPSDKILASLKICRRELNKFPTVADIIKRMSEKSDQSQTQEIVGKIFEAVSWFGYARADEARLRLGPVGWKAVQNFGGWKAICDYPLDQQAALRAQLRMAVEASVNDNTRAMVSGESFHSIEGSHSGMRGIVFSMDDFTH